MACWLAMARQAVHRQAQQSALAACLASLGLLSLAPLALLARVAVALAGQHELPLDEVSVLSALIVLNASCSDEMSVFVMRGSMRLGLLAGVLLLQAVGWLATVGVASSLGVQSVGAASIPVNMGIYVLGRSLAPLLAPGQRCGARLRRGARELRLSLQRAAAMSTGLSVVLYVFLTVFTQMGPASEVLAMGLAMPLLQALLRSLLARVMARAEGEVRERRARYEQQGGSAAAAVPADKPAQQRPAGGAMSLVIVMLTETMYSTGAYTTLALAESEQAFFVSLVSMLLIEVLQLALHVKARRVASRVVDASTAEALRDNSRLRHWLLYQELGEKLGMLLALGVIGLDEALGRGLLAVHAVDAERLATRGAAMLLLGLLGDTAKDLVSQWLGVIPAAGSAMRVPMPPAGVAIAVSQCLAAGLAVKTGLALGAT